MKYLVLFLVAFFIMGGVAFSGSTANFYVGGSTGGQFIPGSVVASPTGWGHPTIFGNRSAISMWESSIGTYKTSFLTPTGGMSYGGTITVNGSRVSTSSWSSSWTMSQGQNLQVPR